MSSRGSRGATAGAMAVMSGSFTPERASSETSAPCRTCETGRVHITIGSYGQTLEHCDNPRCNDARPHPPKPDLGGIDPRPRGRHATRSGE